MRDQDYSCVVDFLERFYAGTEHAVELRALGDGPPAIRFTRDPEIVVDFCTKYDGIGRGCFWAIATRRNGSHTGKRSDLAELPGIWVEIDCYKFGVSKEAVVAALRLCLLPPTIVIDSGGGIHAYWLFKEPMDVRPVDGPDDIKESIDAVLKQLAGVFAGDIAACDITRILRLPGTHNSKTGTLRPVGLIEAHWQARYEFSDLVEMLDYQRPLISPPDQPVAIKPNGFDPFADFARRYTFKPPIDVDARLRAMTYMGDGTAGIHQTRCSVSSSLVTQGVDDDEIFELLLAATRVAAGLYGEKWNWKREEKLIRDEIRTAKEKYTRPKPATKASPRIVQLRPEQATVPAPKAAAEAIELNGYPLNDLGNAGRLILHHKNALRYVVGVGWHVWDKRRYKTDTCLIDSRKLAQETAQAMLLQAFDMKATTEGQAKAKTAITKFAIQSGNDGRINNMLVQAEPHLAVVTDDLDRDPWLLNCLNGTVDLRSGDLRPHAQADLLTKLCGADYDPRAGCPIWERFLLEIFDGDTEMVAFVQRACGYTLTGMTAEQVIFILHGGGSNGKSVFVETIAAVLGEYTTRSPADTWISKHASGPSNDVAALAGARFVPVIETEHDKQLAEALVKQATGGDAMTARFHYKEFFSFTPKFKLWFATNHRPRIRGSDHAIWRRIILLPFGVTFVDADKAVKGQRIKDLTLRDKLMAELPGILAWMVRGCLEWQKDGLKPPASVVHATEGYQDSQDNVSGFVRDCCHQAPGLTCSIALLHAAYEMWCEENDESPLDKRKFGQNLDERGFPPGERNMRSRLRKGIDIKGEYRREAEARIADR